MAKIAFLQIFPEHYVTIDRYFSEDGREDRQNLMMMSCAVWAIEEGFDVQLVRDDETRIDTDGLDAVFIVLFSVAAYRLKHVIDRFRSLPNCRVIVCGPHAVSFPEHCYRAGADTAVGRCNRGLFIEILDGIRTDSLRSSYTTDKPLASFPYQSRFRELGLAPQQNFMNVMSSTGCPYTCEFCTDAAVKYAAVGASEVFDNIRSSDEQFVIFNDPTFGVGREGRALLGQLSGLRERYFAAFTTSSMLRDAEFREQLTEAGFVLVEVGVENINSKFSKNKNVDFIETFSRCDFLILVNYIWGYDSQDAEDATLLFLDELTRACPNIFLMLFAPFSLPETPQHQNLVRDAKIFDPTYLCIGNEIPSIRIAGAASPRDYCEKMLQLNQKLQNGHVERMREWIQNNPRIDRSRKQVMQTMVDRHLAAAVLRDEWAEHILTAAPDSYDSFSQHVMERAIPGFARYDLAL
jgi:hypothetical protein